MEYILSYIISFVLGGIIGAPILLYYGYTILDNVVNKKEPVNLDIEDDKFEFEDTDSELVTKVGWIHVLHHEKELGLPNNNNLSGILSSSLSSLLERRNPHNTKRDKHSCYGVLKKDQLLIYESGNRVECRGAILLSEYQVLLYPDNLMDNEVFKKIHPIHLKHVDSVSNEVSENSSDSGDNGEEEKVIDGSVGEVDKQEVKKETKFEEYFIYLDSSVEKESWFICLLKASKLNKNIKERETLYVDKTAINSLINTLDSSSVHLQTKWLNALLGRVFLGIYKTDKVKEYFINKIKTKTTKVKKPGFLGEILVRDLKVGDSIPYITNPKLINLNKEGELSIEMDLQYNGGFLAEIETIANIQVTSKLKAILIKLLLTVKLKHLSGKILLRIKPPPTNRFWIGFYQLPKMDLEIEPMVSDTQIKSSMIISAIEKRIVDQIKESLVLPNMDDYCFFPSHGSGGIFDNMNLYQDETEEEVIEDDNNSIINNESDGNSKESNSASTAVNAIEKEETISAVEDKPNGSSPSLSPIKIKNLKEKLQSAVSHSHPSSQASSHSNPSLSLNEDAGSANQSKTNTNNFSERLKNYFGSKKKNTIYNNPNSSNSMPDLNNEDKKIQKSNSLYTEFEGPSSSIQLPPKAALDAEGDSFRKRKFIPTQTVKVSSQPFLS